MSSPVIKKTLNLHKYSVRVSNFVPDWKILLPSAFAVGGLLLGCVSGKGEWRLFSKVVQLFRPVLENAAVSPLSGFIQSLLVPTVLAAVLFFLGLSAYGSFASNFIPSVYSFFIGAVSFYMYSTYTLKGLGYCIILVFPYAALSLAGLVLICAESISMSEFMLKTVSNSKRFSDYSFRKFCISVLKGYVLIIVSAIVNVVLSYLFIGLFSF